MCSLFHSPVHVAVNVSTVRKTRSLMDGYWLLCEAVQVTTVFYRYQLLVMTFNLLVHMTLCLYYACLHFSHGDMFYVAIQFPWMAIFIIHLLLLSWPCTLVIDAANETARLVGRLLNYNLHPGIRKQLDLFLLTLPHSSTRVSVCGIYDIHNEMFTSIAASVTTYLVTLVQFHGPAH
uniref:Gustatory receptor n=1 Tax=Homalodisca liturata TaxID=320908 RepID=A0A1B6JL90_9HEMI